MTERTIDFGDCYACAQPLYAAQENDRLLDTLADIRGAVLDALGEGHPIYEKWLADVMGEPMSILPMVREYVSHVTVVKPRVGHGSEGDCSCADEPDPGMVELPRRRLRKHTP